MKRKSKKRKAACAVSNAAGTGNMSEASESSIDEALIKDYMETIANNSGDSDDLIHMAKLQSYIHFHNHSISVAESDSFTENFSPMRPSRRRRRFKRMAVDPQPDSEVSITDYLREQRMKRLTTVRPKVKSQTGVCQFSNSNTMDSESTLERKDTRSARAAGMSSVEVAEGGCGVELVMGKRKRGMKTGNSLDVLDDDSGHSANKSEVM